jgi:hypothetical protein
MKRPGLSRSVAGAGGATLGVAGADAARVWHPWLNPLVVAALRTPVHRLFGRSLALLTVRGIRTGRLYRFPVRFADAGGVLYVIPGGHEHKTWWRNLVRPQPVGLRLRGQDLTGVGQAFSGRHDAEVVAAGLRAYMVRFPDSARLRGVATTGRASPDDPRLPRVLRHEVIVRIVVGGQEGAGWPLLEAGLEPLPH